MKIIPRYKNFFHIFLLNITQKKKEEKKIKTKKEFFVF
jgi:hypothetical protein